MVPRAQHTTMANQPETNAYAAALPDIAARITSTTQMILGTSRVDGAAAAAMQADLMRTLRIQLDTLASTAIKLCDDYTAEPSKAMFEPLASYVHLDPMLLHTK